MKSIVREICQSQWTIDKKKDITWQTTSKDFGRHYYNLLRSCWEIKPTPWSGWISRTFWNVFLVYKSIVIIYLLVCNGIRFIPSQTNVRLGFCDRSLLNAGEEFRAINVRVTHFIIWYNPTMVHLPHWLYEQYISLTYSKFENVFHYADRDKTQPNILSTKKSCIMERTSHHN